MNHPFYEFIDKWWGEVVIGIGNGKGREQFVAAIMLATQDAYNRGKADGIKEVTGE